MSASIRPDEISGILLKELESFQTQGETYEVGTVLQVGDGIARIHGLTNAMAGELVDFKEHEGFEFNVGDKAFKYKINNTENVAEAQSDLNNLVKKFLNKKGEVSDLKGYHKAVYAARNPDSLANHFYEQGKADGLKEIMSKSANIETIMRVPGE